MKYYDAQYPVQTEALRFYDKEILRVLYENMTWDKILTTRTLPRGKKDVQYYVPVVPSDPNLTLDFLEPNEDTLARTPDTIDMLGIHKDCYISMVEMDGSANDIERADQSNLYEISALVGQFVDKVAYRGSSIYFTKSAEVKPPVLDAVGIFNNASVNNIAAGGSGLGSDDDMTAIGDIIYTTGLMITELRTDKHYGPYIMVVTPGIASQFTYNYNATTNATEWQLFQQTFMNPANAQLSGYIKAVVVTPNLVGAALATTNQEMMLVEAKPQNFYMAQTYPLERSPIFRDKKQGYFFDLHWKGIPTIKRPNAICTTTTLITTAAY